MSSMLSLLLAVGLSGVFGSGAYPGEATREGESKRLPPGFREKPKEFEEVLGLRGVASLMVGKVEPGSIADTQGLSQGDLIVGFNGDGMRAFSEWRTFVAELREAALVDQATLEVLKYDPVNETYPSSPTKISVALPRHPGAPRQDRIGFASSFSYFVLAVIKGSPAEKMGVTSGDFIESLDGKQVGNLRGPIDLDLLVEEIASREEPVVTLRLARWRPLGEGRTSGEIREVKAALAR